MDNFGFIHGELDTKILILYVLRRLPRPVDAHTLSDLCSFDNGVSWFDYADCLAGLVDTGHVEALDGERYMITEKGSANGEAAEGLCDLVRQAGATVVGIGICVEKSFQPGHQKLAEEGYHVVSLARVTAIRDGKLIVED